MNDESKLIREREPLRKKYAEILVDPKEIKLLKKRGDQDFIYNVEYKNQEMTLKGWATIEAFEQDTDTMKALQGHPHIASIEGVYIIQTSDLIGAATNFYCTLIKKFDKTLAEMVKEQKLPLELESRFKIALSIAKGLDGLRQAECFHPDLTPHNIILNVDPDSGEITQVRITGFVKPRLYTCGPVIYAAPEIAVGPPVVGSDVYSFSTILLLLYSKEESPLFELVMKTIPKELENFRRLVEECQAFHPNKRPAPAQIVERLTKILGELAPSSKSSQQSKEIKEDKYIPPISKETTKPSLIAGLMKWFSFGNEPIKDKSVVTSSSKTLG